ncbi:hypothetical protein [Umezawaea sp. NPDC059074]|uniref:hypothetical protein n=1 Tax=Umezawaea sp. NPDC059074 TaxID=3346716 RepID=UPI00369C4D37
MIPDEGKAAHLVLDLDAESVGVLAGALLSGEGCAVPVHHGHARLLLSARSDAYRTRLHLGPSD